MPKKGKKCKKFLVSSNANRNTYTEDKCDTIFIGINNVKKWIDLKKQLHYVSDSEFTSYLLDLAVKDLRNSYTVCSEPEDFRNESSEKCRNDSELCQVVSSMEKIQNKKLSSYETSTVDPLVAEMKSEVCENNQELHVLSPSQVFEVKCHKYTTAKTELDNKMTVLQPVNYQGECLNISKHLLSRQERDKSSNQHFKQIVKVKRRKKKRSHEDNNIEDALGFKHKKRKHKHNEHRKHNADAGSNHLTREKEDTAKCGECITTELELSKHDSAFNITESKLCTINKGEDSLCDQDNQRVAITIKLCCDCDLHHLQNACPLRKAVRVIKDTVTLHEWVNERTKCKMVTDRTDNINDTYKISASTCFAEISLPKCLDLKIVDGKHNRGVFTKEDLPAYVEFGPLVGKIIREMEIPDDFSMKDIWEIADSTGCMYLSTQDPNHSNWLRWIRPAPTRESRNLAVLLRNRELVFVTTVPLAAGNELLFWADSTNAAWANKKMCKINCGGCNLRFGHPMYYRLHCAVFHDPNFSLTIRKYHCKVCGVSVLGKENIVKHAADNHDGKGAYQCQFCKKFFLRLNYLEIHRTYGCAANPYRTRPLCDYCGRKFCQPQKLKVHIKRMHSDMSEVLREFQCKRCLKLLGSRTALQRHNKEVHRKDIVGACTCDRCGKMFQNKSNLKIHMLTHSGIKPFKCREINCVAAFTTKQCLQFHYKKVHGFTDSMMPKIERSVAYTFDAYAGGKRPDSVNSDYSHTSTNDESDQGKLQNSDSLNTSSPSHRSEDDQQQPQSLDMLSKVVSKGSKKWLGTTFENLEEKNTVFEFEDEKTNIILPKEQPLPILFRHCKPNSSSASLLVEAAIDAAEKEIDISGSTKPQPTVVSNKSPDILYPVLRSHLTGSPSQQVLGHSGTPSDYSACGPQDHSQSPQLQVETLYSTSVSPRHATYGLLFPDRTPHYELHFSPNAGQVETFHLEDSRFDSHHRRTEENSSDDGVSVAQNLSMSIKNKSLQLDFPTTYKYDNLEDRNGFEPLEGLDMTRSCNYHHPTFVSVTPRYPHAVYDQRTYSHSDILRVVNLTHSVDLSLSRNNHHQLTSNQVLVDPVRIISPTPTYQSYPLSSSPYLTASRTSHSPTYHHYTSY